MPCRTPGNTRARLQSSISYASVSAAARQGVCHVYLYIYIYTCVPIWRHRHSKTKVDIVGTYLHRQTIGYSLSSSPSFSFFLPLSSSFYSLPLLLSFSSLPLFPPPPLTKQGRKGYGHRYQGRRRKKREGKQKKKGPPFPFLASHSYETWGTCDSRRLSRRWRYLVKRLHYKELRLSLYKETLNQTAWKSALSNIQCPN